MIQMNREILHSPDGVSDVYGRACLIKHTVEHRIHKVMELYGFEDIETPSFEYLDLFLQEGTTVSSREMVKFFDREGNTLVLRPDFTPSIARCVAKYYAEEEFPIRLCYQGHTFVNTERYQGRSKETTQLGAELINDASIDADAEMIAMVIECLRQAGLTQFQVEIGHADFFNGLLEEVDLSEQEIDLLKVYLEQKNMSGLEILLQDKEMDPAVKNLLIDLPMLFGNVNSLSDAVSRTDNRRALEAVRRLSDLYEVLDSYGFQSYVTFDLGLLSQHDYYTGIIFKAYTYGTGDPIALGGRYDHLIAKFGKEAPSIGFAILVDSLLNALNSQAQTVPVEERILLLYPSDVRKEAIAYGHELRLKGHLVSFIRKSSRREVSSYAAYARKQGYSRLLWMARPGEIASIELTEAAP